MTSGENEREEASPPEGTGDGMNLLIGWRAGREDAPGVPAPDRGAEEAGVEAAADPAPASAVTMAGLAAGQQRILALLEDLASKRAEATTGEAGTDLREAAAAIQAATEWASDIRAAIEALLASTGKSIQNLNAAEQGLGEEAAALKTRAGDIEGQVEALRSGARMLGTRLRQLDEARQKLDTRSEELQTVKQEIAKYYDEWTAAALAYRQEMAAVLVLMLPTLPIMGALGQSELGVFSPYDDTDGWKRNVWEQSGEQVKRCLKEALGSSEPITCTFEVRWK